MKLGAIREVLRSYCRALAGRDVELEASQRLVERNVGWIDGDLPTTDGRTIFVPAAVDRFATERENFLWYKVLCTHQVGHIEFGSFDLDFDRRSILFRQDRLARDVFALAEDTRIDWRILREYPGLAGAFAVARADALRNRPRMDGLAAREAQVEWMVRVSLEQIEERFAPAAHRDTAPRLCALLDGLKDPGARVADAAEIALRIYALLREIPDEPPAQPGVRATDSGRGPSREDRDAEYRPPRGVDYRGQFKPELAQLLSQGMLSREPGRGSEADRRVIERRVVELVANSPEVELRGGDTPGRARREELAQNLVREVWECDPRRQPRRTETEDRDLREGPLAATGPGSFVYDEWDHWAKAYRPDWCLVEEKQLAGGETGFFDDTLARHASLAHELRRQFELLAPELHAKEKHLEDGEEHDFDAAVEAMIDLAVGRTPSEKLFWRRNKTERNVAVALLLDMSASTGEAIDGASDRPGGRRKRIIDVEKEALVLLVNALEALNDRFGIYGFSGYGRKNVEFYVIKDLGQPFSRDVARRIDRIAPLFATRMGPAIRHATARLSQEPARSRFLFLLSDGRPQDRGYGSEGEHRQYAVRDSRMALLEARRRGITPFCLTVDEGGHDYLTTMMHGMDYEVLSDIGCLPVRLPQLYKRLTT